MWPNRSVAVWCGSRGENRTFIETHFNYWRIAGDEEFCRRSAVQVNDFLEIGVMIEDIGSVEKVFVYLPAQIDRKLIEDCAPLLAKPEIAQGIFNEVLATTVAPPPSRHIDLNSNAGVFCRVHKFLKEEGQINPRELEITSIEDGTILCINANALAEVGRGAAAGTKAYFRIRVYISDEVEDAFLRKTDIPDRMFQSGFNQVEYIDFRFNEARTLPTNVETMMRNEKGSANVLVRLVAFLTAFPAII